MSRQDDFVLSKAKIAIIGLGLMGGSLALAIRGKCAAIYGIEPDKATRDLALEQNIVDFAEPNPSILLPQADLVVLAAPVLQILSILESLAEYTPNPCIVLDLGSSKAEIVEKMATLPDRFDPIGGHPICGKEQLSLKNADRTLFFGAPFLLTPLARTTSRALVACNQIISAIGAKPEVLNAEEHDRILACTSHLPFVISSALVLATPPNVAPYIGPGFRSASRLAGTPASMMLGVILTNQENILAALERIQDELALLTSLVAEKDKDGLYNLLVSAEDIYSNLMDKRN